MTLRTLDLIIVAAYLAPPPSTTHPGKTGHCPNAAMASGSFEPPMDSCLDKRPMAHISSINATGRSLNRATMSA